jgi:hypothetical protein
MMATNATSRIKVALREYLIGAELRTHHAGAYTAYITPVAVKYDTKTY